MKPQVALEKWEVGNQGKSGLPKLPKAEEPASTQCHSCSPCAGLSQGTRAPTTPIPANGQKIIQNREEVKY